MLLSRSRIICGGIGTCVQNTGCARRGSGAAALAAGAWVDIRQVACADVVRASPLQRGEKRRGAHGGPRPAQHSTRGGRQRFRGRRRRRLADGGTAGREAHRGRRVLAGRDAGDRGAPTTLAPRLCTALPPYAPSATGARVCGVLSCVRRVYQRTRRVSTPELSPLPAVCSISLPEQQRHTRRAWFAASLATEGRGVSGGSADRATHRLAPFQARGTIRVRGRTLHATIQRCVISTSSPSTACRGDVCTHRRADKKRWMCLGNSS